MLKYEYSYAENSSGRRTLVLALPEEHRTITYTKTALDVWFYMRIFNQLENCPCCNNCFIATDQEILCPKTFNGAIHYADGVYSRGLKQFKDQIVKPAPERKVFVRRGQFIGMPLESWQHPYNSVILQELMMHHPQNLALYNQWYACSIERKGYPLDLLTVQNGWVFGKLPPDSKINLTSWQLYAPEDWRYYFRFLRELLKTPASNHQAYNATDDDQEKFNAWWQQLAGTTSKQ